MATTKTPKKNLIVSYKNLPDDLKEKFKLAYPEGYSNYITRFTKPNGDSIFVVPFDTPDTANEMTDWVKEALYGTFGSKGGRFVMVGNLISKTSVLANIAASKGVFLRFNSSTFYI